MYQEIYVDLPAILDTAVVDCLPTDRPTEAVGSSGTRDDARAVDDRR